MFIRNWCFQRFFFAKPHVYCAIFMYSRWLAVLFVSLRSPHPHPLSGHFQLRPWRDVKPPSFLLIAWESYTAPSRRQCKYVNISPPGLGLKVNTFIFPESLPFLQERFKDFYKVTNNSSSFQLILKNHLIVKF